MTDRPSDRATAQAFWKACDTVNLDKKALVDLLNRIELDAREIDAAAPDGAQAVGEVCVHDSYRYARLFNAEECALPEGTKLYTTPPSLNNEKTVPGFPGCTLERRHDYSILLRRGEEKLAQAYNRINHEYFLYQIFNAILDDEITRSTS